MDDIFVFLERNKIIPKTINISMIHTNININVQCMRFPNPIKIKQSINEYVCITTNNNDNIDLYFLYWSYLPNPSARVGYDTRSIFKWSLTGLNSEFSFS